VSQELGFSSEKLIASAAVSSLVFQNQILNHLLNISCTIADAGALGAILWAFEAREVLQEQVENATGARLHVNLNFVGLHSLCFSAGNVGIDVVISLL
jgi:hypothetical protein